MSDIVFRLTTAVAREGDVFENTLSFHKLPFLFFRNMKKLRDMKIMHSVDVP